MRQLCVNVTKNESFLLKVPFEVDLLSTTILAIMQFYNDRFDIFKKETVTSLE
jgi:hypothetical protein